MCIFFREQLFFGLTFLLLFTTSSVLAQHKSLFKRFPIDSMGIIPYELYPTLEGATVMTSSIGIWTLIGRQFDGPQMGSGIMYDSKGRPIYQNIKMRNYTAEDSIRGMAQGPDSVFYFV